MTRPTARPTATVPPAEVGLTAKGLLRKNVKEPQLGSRVRAHHITRALDVNIEGVAKLLEANSSKTTFELKWYYEMPLNAISGYERHL
jgi:hypothetical protein